MPLRTCIQRYMVFYKSFFSVQHVLDHVWKVLAYDICSKSCRICRLDKDLHVILTSMLSIYTHGKKKVCVRLKLT